MREREKSSSLSERHEKKDEEQSEADGGGDRGVLEDVSVTSSRGRRHIVARAAQVFVTAEKIIDRLPMHWNLMRRDEMCLLVRVAVAGETKGLDMAANVSLLAESLQSDVGVGVLSDGAGRHLGWADLVGDSGENTLDTGA